MHTSVAHKLERPELTLPTAEADWLRDAYSAADVILEYGSGGSTVMASDMADKMVTSVESDKDWAAKMRAWFSENPSLSLPEILHVDLGKTGEWGMPENDRRWRAFPNYPLSVWDLVGFRQPDVVLVDGRFRVG